MKNCTFCMGRQPRGRATKLSSRFHILLALLMGLLFSAASIRAEVRTWTGTASSDWLNATNWNPRGVPQPGDTVNITSGNVSFSSPVAFSGEINWTGGRLLVAGTLTLLPETVLNVSGNGTKEMGSGTLVNLGRIVWSDAGSLSWVDGSLGLWVNHADATWEITGDATFFKTFGSGGAITNLGTVVKSGGNGTTMFGGPFYNYGLVDAQTNILSFQGGGGGAGEFRAAAGAQNRFEGGTFRWADATFTGGGASRLTGMVTVHGTATSENLELISGLNLYGTNTFGGTVRWTGGRLATGQLTMATGAELRISGNGAKEMGSGTLVNLGRIVWSDAGSLTWVDGSLGLWVNQPGATWEITGDATFFKTFGSGGAITNLGTVVKSGGNGTTMFGGPFYNYGLVDAQTNILSFQGGGGGAGEFRAAAGAQNRFEAGTFRWADATFTGGGASRLTGLVTVHGTATSENLELISGLNLYGTNTFGGTVRWTGGRLATGQLTMATGAELRISGNGAKEMGSGTLVNLGRIVWSDAGSLTWVDGSLGLWVNQPGATWEITGDVGFYLSYGNGGTFTNLGTVVKSGGSGTTVLYGPFYNHGLVEVASGTLRLASSVTLDPGSEVSFAIGGATPSVQHGVLSLNGAVGLQGTAKARLVNGFVPVADQMFTVIQGGTLSGAFANTNILVPGTFWSFLPEYPANQVRLRAVFRTPTPSTVAAGWQNGSLQLQLAGGTGENYAVEASTNLTHWTTLWVTNLPAPVLQFTDLEATNYPSRFYRAVAVP